MRSHPQHVIMKSLLHSISDDNQFSFLIIDQQSKFCNFLLSWTLCLIAENLGIQVWTGGANAKYG